ncbi:MAG TPA: dihydroorotate dehydrogenase electron transfer subunit [Syntrophales bacterium]|nr:dihydroorotate dehydrogenase electron transfer subunit [Syntrophales bacterium]
MEGEIQSNDEVSPGHRRLVVAVSGRHEEPVPGQFAMVRVARGLDPLLARPLSFYGYRRRGGTGYMEFLYRVTGRGTRILSERCEGEELVLTGPLGRGFDIPPGARRIGLVAGGMGVAPLTYLARYCRERASGSIRITTYVGARTAAALVGLEELSALSSEVVVTTDDGTYGTCGVVTAALEADMGDLCRDGVIFFACGPRAMMARLAECLIPAGVPCQVSLEERMACGLGACLGCAVAVRRGDGETYASVCKDGPVFPLAEVVWEGK